MTGLKGFLERDVSERLSCKQNDGFGELQCHSWFQTIDWMALEVKELPPPFIPDSKKANFDASRELEEFLLEGNPLKAKAGETRDVNTFSTEKRQMEEPFTSYDFKKMTRRPYYSHITSTITATSSNGLEASRGPVTDSRSEGFGIAHRESKFDKDMRLEEMPREKHYS